MDLLELVLGDDIVLLVGLLTVLLPLEPGKLVRGAVHGSGIDVAPGFLQPVPCAYGSDSGS